MKKMRRKCGRKPLTKKSWSRRYLKESGIRLKRSRRFWRERSVSDRKKECWQINL